MEFWGAEVKSGVPLEVEPGDEMILHISQACLPEVKKDKGNESVCLYLKIGNQKLVLGTLSPEKFPQLSFDLAFEKKIELSHNWKNGSVYFTGYKVFQPDHGRSESDHDSEEELPIPFDNADSKATQSKPIVEKENAKEQNSNAAAKQVKIVEPNKGIKPTQDEDDSPDEDDDSEDDESDSEDSKDLSDDQRVQHLVNNEDESSDSDEEDESEEEDDNDDLDTSEDDNATPQKVKAEPSKKRPIESAARTPIPDKKAKFNTPQKTDGKKGVVRTATPHPSKQVVKTPADSAQNKQKTQKSGAFSCKFCKRSFNSEGAVQSHTKAKHSAT